MWGALPGSLQLGSPFLGVGTLFKDQEMRPVLLSGGLGEMTASGDGEGTGLPATVCSYSYFPAHVSRSRLCN